MDEEMFMRLVGMKTALDFHPRAAKLMRKRKNFVVVAEDEPYFVLVYELIRMFERQKKTWTANDESLFVSARKKAEGA